MLVIACKNSKLLNIGINLDILVFCLDCFFFIKQIDTLREEILVGI